LGTTFIGIDNGVSGTMGVIYPSGEYHMIHTPVKNKLHWTKVEQRVNRVDHVKFKSLLKKVLKKSKTNLKIYIERPFSNAMRYKAAISAARCHEAMEVIFEQLKIPYEILDSKNWQDVLLPKLNTKRKKQKVDPNTGKKKRHTRSDTDLKKLSLEVGKRLFPKIKIKHADYDGILIAEYGKRTSIQ
jgi:hypothetical protein